jgi:LAO/AO transport system kinase
MKNTPQVWASSLVDSTEPVRQRRVLAKAITLIESTRPQHRKLADQILNEVMPFTGKSLRLGLSGAPGVGKSTFIEALGLHLIGSGHRVAVLAVDPSSKVHGGSILGDKTRMEKLSTSEHAFIRPTPSAGRLGGVAQRTREAMLLCEAAGFDVVLVETVGVGQSETVVADMTDLLVLLQLPHAGDDLQALKKGVLEWADFVLINKADLHPLAARQAQHQIEAMASLGPPRPDAIRPLLQVMLLSAQTGQGLVEFWQSVSSCAEQNLSSQRTHERRQAQNQVWLQHEIALQLLARFENHLRVKTALKEIQGRVVTGEVTASQGARDLVDIFCSL